MCKYITWKEHYLLECAAYTSECGNANALITYIGTLIHALDKLYAVRIIYRVWEGWEEKGRPSGKGSAVAERGKAIHIRGPLNEREN